MTINFSRFYYMRYFLFFILLSTSLFGQSDTTKSAIIASDTVKKQEIVEFKSYKMTVPEGWQIKTGCVEGQCTLTSKRDTVGKFDMYIESINLTINNLNSPSYTAEKYATFSIGYLPKVVNQFKVIEKRKLSANSYRLTYAGEKNGLFQTWRQYYYVKSSKVYIVTFSGETSKYDYWQPIVEPYLSSFKLK